MNFFLDDEGHLHIGRFMAVLNSVALIWGCGSHVPEPLCLSRAVFALGWWIGFCEKRPSRTVSELAHHPHNVIGAAVLIGALIAENYFTGAPSLGSYGSRRIVLLVGIASICVGVLYRRYGK